MTPSEAISAAIYQRLAASAELAAMLGDPFEGGPKIFTSRPVPDEASEPLIIVNGPVPGAVESCSLSDNRRLRTQGRRIVLVWPNYGSTADVDAAAELVSRLLHRAPFELAPSVLRRVSAGEPTEVPADKVDSIARGVELSVVFVEPG